MVTGEAWLGPKPYSDQNDFNQPGDSVCGTFQEANFFMDTSLQRLRLGQLNPDLALCFAPYQLCNLGPII